MTRIRATCPTCGEVDLTPADIHLQVLRTEVEDIAAGSTYRFSCPDCDEHVTKPADERIARLLTTGGVEVSVTEVADAAALPEHPEAPVLDRAPLGYDDLIDFHQLLADPDWFDALADLVA